jgi:hypothetical protein
MREQRCSARICGLNVGARFGGPRGERASGPRGERANGPRGERANGPRGERASGPRDERASGPRGERASFPRADRAGDDEPRRAFSARGGAQTSRGDEALASKLVAALRAADSGDEHELTHGFHTYPARMHPLLARELVRAFAEPGAVVLDPFCGSGTVLIEALVHGCRAQGVDLNPIALRISEQQTALRDGASRRRFLGALRAVALASEDRVRSRAHAHIVLERADSDQYQPHVLFELCGLLEEIEVVPEESDRRALSLVFSSLLVKFSRRRADTSSEHVEKRLRKGLATEFFVRKGEELVERWRLLFEAAPRPAYGVRLACGDARALPELLGPSFRADLVLTSPPYGGTYDYADQHALRLAWFGLTDNDLLSHELGARRELSRDANGPARWDDELTAALRALRSSLAHTGRAVLWIGDADLAGRRIPADEQIARISPAAGLELLASATQERKDIRGGEPRGEHLLLLAATGR